MRKKIKGSLLYSVIFVFLLYVFFSIPTGRETRLKPVWIRNLSDTQVNSKLDEKACYGFSLGDAFGYVDLKGNFLYKSNIYYNLALAESAFINFSSVQEANQSLVCYKPNGDFKSSFPVSGYPVFNRYGDRLFLIKLDGSGIKEIDQDGNEAWSQEFASVITTFAASRDNSVVGLLNGTLRYYNKTGKCLYKLDPEGSRIPVILGSAISNLGDKFGCVFGIDPQQLVFVSRSANDFNKPVYSDLDTDFRREVMIKFSENGIFLYIEGKESLKVMDTAGGAVYSIPFAGHLLDISPGLDNSYVFVSSKHGPRTQIKLVKPPFYTIITESYESTSDFIKQLDGHLLLGMDGSLLLFNIEEV
ncbi:MAG: hypothetical protein JW969_03480 [Spirochaetales bacterium]|nr:hypothetical protein [Spirochaetales bacterium]